MLAYQPTNRHRFKQLDDLLSSLGRMAAENNIAFLVRALLTWEVGEFDVARARHRTE
jgi:hypothetical protein